MAEVLGTFNQVLLNGTKQTIYTVPPSHTFIPKTISIVNIKSNTFPTFTLWFVKNGETPSDKNIITINQYA